MAYLDMTDPNTDCPDGWTTLVERLCAKVHNTAFVCESVFFPVIGGEYTRVCGTIRAYQLGGTYAFQRYHNGDISTIDSPYVDGVSLTHGNPQQHIWTFAAGDMEELPDRHDVCSCDATVNITIPQFVGGDYFCESGKNLTYHPYFAAADPLWDGEGCTSTSTCCEFNNPPYFIKQLSSPTDDIIEARLCHYDGIGGTRIEFMELYVK